MATEQEKTLARHSLIFALDVSDAEEARRLTKLLVGRVGLFKIGLELFIACGPSVVQAVKEEGGEVFLDLKLHDIPATVARAAAAAARLGVRMITVHTQGGARMIAAAVQGAAEAAGAAKTTAPDVIGVTVLTSLSDRDLAQLGYPGTAADTVMQLAAVAAAAGASGVVASPKEAEHLRREAGRDFRIVTPGVRPSWYDAASRAADDQARVDTPSVAIESGADYIVVGRPIRDAGDPAAAADKVVTEIVRGIRKRAEKTVGR